MNTNLSPKNLFYITGLILIIVACIAFIYVYATQEDQGAVPSNQTVIESLKLDDSMVVEQKKEAILTRTRGASLKPLTPAEKDLIFNELGGSGGARYNFTTSENEIVLKALNGK